MATYVVGDLQGCLGCLEQLLDKVGFKPSQDQLWAAGDLVNRGPQSLETLRFCMSLGSSFKTVLGNHDLHLLAVARGYRAPNHKDTLEPILNAPDRKNVLEWLQHQPLLIHDKQVTLVHAGIPPQWAINDAKNYANEVENVLRSEHAGSFFTHMYGNSPDCWQPELAGPDRWRVITNYFTRMRFCDEMGRLELTTKLGPTAAPAGFKPWFSHSERHMKNDTILFGHWAALNGHTDTDKAIALDTGCVWGGRLRLYCLETHHFTHVNCNAL